MKKQLLLGSMSALMLTSGLHANMDGFYGNEWNNNNDVFAYNECCDSGKLLVDVEFLWWSPGNYYPFANNSFINVGSPVVSPDAPLASSTNTINEPYVRISEKWSPGVRVGLGWEMDHDYKVLASWTGYSNYARRVINATTPTLVSGVAPVNGGTTLAVVGDNFLDSAVVDGIFPTAAVANYKLNYNVIDVAFERTFQPSCELTLAPYAGLRTAFIHQRQYVSFEGASETIDGGLVAELPANSRFSEKLWGIGPKIGVGVVYGDWCGLSLIGNVSGSILYGRVKEYARTSSTTLADDSTVILTSNGRTRDRYSVVVPNAQIQLGFNYKLDLDFCGCSNFLPFDSGLNIYALVEGNYYGNASTVFLHERGLGLYGLTLGLSFDW